MANPFSEEEQETIYKMWDTIASMPAEDRDTIMNGIYILYNVMDLSLLEENGIFEKDGTGKYRPVIQARGYEE